MNNHDGNDIDPIETQEWLEALASLIEEESPERARYIVEQLVNQSRQEGVNLPSFARTPYVNTLSADQEPAYPGDLAIESRLNAYMRWNAMAMVVRAGHQAPELGGHIASYGSSAILYEVGFNHFFKADKGNGTGDLVFIQGHSSPGIYARAFLEGRLKKSHLDLFRQEVGVDGLSSYPHPWLMPEFWQFPTVSMGLGPIQAIYQARFLKYLENRGLIEPNSRKVWVFCGDGEMDEPESLGAINIAMREKLDNLIFVVSCNLQRLDGPVCGNRKIIQDLEGIFSGAGWRVIKAIWSSAWDELLAQDTDGKLKKCMMETIDGEYQNIMAKGGAYMREHFFGKDPELKERVAHLSDEELEQLEWGGHDPKKVYAAYHAAVNHTGEPIVVLAKTVKGYGMGAVGKAQNTAHQQKKMGLEDLKAMKERFDIPVADNKIKEAPYYMPDAKSAELKYLHERRKALQGYLPARRVTSDDELKMPALDVFAPITKGSGEREISTTMAFVRILNILLKDKSLKERIVPIVPDECRTFGMEGMFRQLGLYAPEGQLYTPVDADQLMYLREDKTGQILDEGLTEAGAFCSWIAAATSYSVNNLPMIPFYVYYSMFGFQRTGDLAWAAGDSRARGFLLGGTAGRTTLAGEGLQHQDGHNLLMASMVPNCISYDPAFGYELAVIIQDGLRRMYENQEDIYYYLTLMNENYTHPEMPEGVEEGILKGMYPLKTGKKQTKKRVRLLGSGTILREVIKAAEILEADYGVVTDVWSVTSFNQLYREATAIDRWNRLHPKSKEKHSYVRDCMTQAKGPVIAATDYMHAYANQICAYIDEPFTVLGTDGYGRSDTREKLRYFFEVNHQSIIVASLKALSNDDQIPATTVAEAMKKFKVDPKKPDPLTV